MLNFKHIAIIMDGNGRWAQERRRPRVWGHIRGAQMTNEIIDQADECGVKSLTLFAFSTENWSRPAQEITVLFSLLKKYIQKERQRILKNNIRFKVIGSTVHLPVETKKLIYQLEEETKLAVGLKLNFAFDYGGRNEILQSVNKFINQYPGQPLQEKNVTENLETFELGDVDLLIRTGGEYRVSNFLLWQLAYAELFFTTTKWPDFTRDEFKEILTVVAKRERRFGGIGNSSDFQKNFTEAQLHKEKLIQFTQSNATSEQAISQSKKKKGFSDGQS